MLWSRIYPKITHQVTIEYTLHTSKHYFWGGGNWKISWRGSWIPARFAARSKLPLFFLLPALSWSRLRYSCRRRIHRIAVGEKGMHPDRSFRHRRSAASMHSAPCWSILLIWFATHVLDWLLLCTSPNRSIIRCCSISPSSTATYFSATVGILVLRRRVAGLTIVMEDVPTMVEVKKSTTKSRWSPTP